MGGSLKTYIESNNCTHIPLAGLVLEKKLKWCFDCYVYLSFIRISILEDLKHYLT